MCIRDRIIIPSISVRSDSLRTVTNNRSIIPIPFESVQYLLYSVNEDQKKGNLYEFVVHYSRVVDGINDVLIITTSPPPLLPAVRSHTTPHPAVYVVFGNVWCSAS